MISNTMIRNTSPSIIQFQSRLQHILPIQLLLSRRQISGNALDKIQDDDDNPLILLRNRAMKKNLCDEHGGRLPGKFWTFSMSASRATNELKAPNLKTVGLQRLTDEGIDFITLKKKKNGLMNEQPISMLQTFGNYQIGEHVEQWRAEGFCEELSDLKDILPYIPPNTIIEMIATNRVISSSLDNDIAPPNDVDHHSKLVQNHAHLQEVVQTTRYELENGKIHLNEMSQTIQGWRFVPTRVERLVGSPDEIMWDRWEWIRSSKNSTWEKSSNPLLPY